MGDEASVLRRLVLAILGVLIGVYGALTGIGGGIFAVPLLHYAYKLPLKEAVAGSLVLVAAATTSATLFELLHPCNAISLPVTATLVVASLLGTRLGYVVSKKIDVRTLKLVFCVLLTGVGLQMLLRSTPAASLATSSFAGSALEYGFVAVIGLAAGFVAPLLGIGGGLLAVPGLVYGVPELGYLGARASSQAMSMCTAWQSVVLYVRDGALRAKNFAWLGAGGFVGSAIGIQLVHVESVTRVAQSLVSVALFFAAARFAFDVKRSRAQPRP